MAHATLSFDAALTKIHQDAVKAAQNFIDSEEEIALAIPAGPWTADQKSALEAARNHYQSQAEAYRDNPEPFGKRRSDSSSWLRYFQSAIPTGRHRTILSTMPRFERHILECARTSGTEVLLPHPADGDPTPRHLRVETIIRRFACSVELAGDLQLFFSILECTPDTVDHFATQIRTGLDPYILAIQLHRLSAEMLALEPSAEDAMEQILTTYYDGEDLEDEEEREDADGEPVDGQYEAIAYHKVGKGDLEPDPLEGDPLYEQITRATPDQIAKMKKEMFELQKSGKGNRTNRQWSWLWLQVKAREDGFLATDRTLRRALTALDSAQTFRALARLGREMFAPSKRWPSHARRQFWAEYNRRKAEVSPATHAA